jgi:hypothetical protein
MGLKKFIKQRDAFGHPVELNFNKQGSSFKTTPGGCTTILIYIMLLVYVQILMQ